MRLKCEYKTDKILLANRMMLVSLIKTAIKTEDSKYFKELYEYEDKSNKQSKNFSFSIMLKDFKINGEVIEIKDRIVLNISTPDYKFGINIYNGLLKMHEFKYKDEYVLHKLKISLIKEKFISDGQAVFKTLSPICIKNKNNEFIGPEDKDFQDELNYIANKSLENFRGTGLKKNLEFKNVLMKKVVVKEEIREFTKQTGKQFFYVNSYLGVFKLTGDPEDLNLIYQMGLGFRRSQGWGLLDIV